MPMTKEMIAKIEAVLERVREPETGLPVARINLVQRVRYQPEAGRLLVFKNPLRTTHGCCTILANLVLESTLKELQREFSREFPELNVEIV